MTMKALLLTILLLCATAHAADDWDGYGRADKVKMEGVALYQGGKIPEAIEKVEEAERLMASLSGDGSTFRTTVEFWLKGIRTLLASMNTAVGRSAKTLPFLLGQYEQFRKDGGQPEIDTIALIENIADAYFADAGYAQSLEFAGTGLKEVDKVRGLAPHVFIARKTGMYDRMAKAMLFLGRTEDAAATFEEGQRLYDTAFLNEPIFDDTAGRMSKFAYAYQGIGQFARAESMYLRSQERLERLQRMGGETGGKAAKNILHAKANLAGMYVEAGQYAKGRELILRLIADAEKTYGQNYQGYGIHLGHLVVAESVLGLYGSALQHGQRALTVNEMQFGPESVNTAASLRNLAGLHMGLGDYSSAESMLQRVLKIRIRQRGESHAEVAEAYRYLAALYSRAKRNDEALEMARRAVQIMERSKGSVQYGNALGDLASMEAAAGQLDAALMHATDALSANQKSYGEGSYVVAGAKIRLAGLLTRSGKFAEAAPLLQQALATLDVSAYAASVYVPSGLSIQARAAAALGQRDVALQAVRLMLSRLQAGSGARGDDNEQDRELVRNLLVGGLRALHEANAADIALQDSFEAAQLARASDAAKALTQMTARFAAGEGDIASLIRTRQDHAAHYQALAKKLTALSSSVPPAAPAMLEAARMQAEQARKELAAQDAQIAQRFPQYNQLIEGRPQGLAAVRAALEPGEAMVSFLMAPDLRPGYELPATAAPMSQVYAWVIRRDSGTWVKLDTSQKELEQLVQEVRQSTDLTGPSVKPFATGAAHALYRKLLAPLKSRLAGIQRLVIVPDGPLTSLPFPALLAAPATAPAQMVGYRKLPWLAEEYGLSILPSEASLVALRSNMRATQAPQALAGFGDPLFQGTDSTKRGIKSVSLYSPAATARGAAASIDSVRMLARLPETADELRQIARVLGGSEQSLFLQQRASEDMVKSTDLTPYRVISFATHGLMAGEFSGLSEPGLALTPPSTADQGNEGFLSSSEAAQLKLNADWVVLSACNTAAPDGKPGASGLSGLSSAFLYAGARSVLVSHWAVDSEATVSLMSRLFANRAKGMSKAESHRKAMLGLKNESKNADYAHPAFWAPFVVIGEGK